MPPASGSTNYATALLNLQYFFLFVFHCLIQPLDVVVGQLLALFQRPPFFILADQLVFQQLLDVLVAIAPDVAQRDAMVFGNMMDLLHQLLAPLFGERRDGHPNQLAVVGGVQSQLGSPDGLLDGSDLRNVPGLHRDHGCVGDVQSGQLIQRRGRSIIVRPDIVEQAHRSPPGAYSGHFVL